MSDTVAVHVFNSTKDLLYDVSGVALTVGTTRYNLIEQFSSSNSSSC